jgi:DinB superfamily
MVEQHISSGERRWLTKAVREMAGELYRQLSGVNEKGLRWRPGPRDWCLKEIAAHMRDAEVLYQRQIETIVQGHSRLRRLPHEPLDVLPTERNYIDDSLQHFLYEYEAAREETVWLLYTLDEEDWLRTGLHPYRGEISVYDIAREMHEHDLQHLNQARITREALDKRFGRTRREED